MYLGPRLSRVGLDIHTPTPHGTMDQRLSLCNSLQCVRAYHNRRVGILQNSTSHSARTAPETRLSSPNPCPTATPTGHTPPTARDIPPESSADTSTLHIPQSVAKHGRGDEPVMTVFSRTVDCQEANATSLQLCFSFPCASKSPSRSQANVAGVTRSRIACN